MGGRDPYLHLPRGVVIRASTPKGGRDPDPTPPPRPPLGPILFSLPVPLIFRPCSRISSHHSPPDSPFTPPPPLQVVELECRSLTWARAFYQRCQHAVPWHAMLR